MDFIEVKRVKTKLAAKQLRQVDMYAVDEGVDWAVLHERLRVAVFHLRDRVPIEMDLALQSGHPRVPVCGVYLESPGIRRAAGDPQHQVRAHPG
jgi:hypothetical protein